MKSLGVARATRVARRRWQELPQLRPARRRRVGHGVDPGQPRRLLVHGCSQRVQHAAVRLLLDQIQKIMLIHRHLLLLYNSYLAIHVPYPAIMLFNF